VSQRASASPVPVGFAGVVLDAPNPHELAEFYCRLLGWSLLTDEADWVMIHSPGSTTHLSFQTEPEYRRPRWPSRSEHQQMQVHLDFKVEDLEAAHEHAVAVGATPAEWQPQEQCRVYTDPVGHVFCLFVD
jgi:catechol-2,3-dioxygenase